MSRALHHAGCTSKLTVQLPLQGSKPETKRKKEMPCGKNSETLLSMSFSMSSGVFGQNEYRQIAPRRHAE
jgi:hypothetical protein